MWTVEIDHVLAGQNVARRVRLLIQPAAESRIRGKRTPRMEASWQPCEALYARRAPAAFWSILDQ